MTYQPIKDRLKSSLTTGEKFQVKEALYTYLAREDPEVSKTTFDNLPIAVLLPELKALSDVWKSMTAAEMVTSHKAIAQLYHTIRNQFGNMDNLVI